MKSGLTLFFLFRFGILLAQTSVIPVEMDTCLNFIKPVKSSQDGDSSFHIKGQADILLHRIYVGDTSNYLLGLGNKETNALLTQKLGDWGYECESDLVISCRMAKDSAYYQDTIDMNYYRFISEKDTVGKLIVVQIQWEHWHAYSEYHEHRYDTYVFYPKQKRQLTYADIVDTLHERKLAEFVCNAYAAQLIDMEFSEKDKELIAWDYANDSYNLLNNFKVTGSSVIFYLSSENHFSHLDFEFEVKIADFPSSFNKKFKKLVGR